MARFPDFLADKNYFDDNNSSNMVDNNNSNNMEFIIDNIKYEIISEEERTVKIVRNEGAEYSGSLILRPTVHFITDFKVVEIGEKAFEGCAKITSVQFPETVTLIDRSAFDKCKGLTSLELPENLEKIESFAFEDCENVCSIKFPESLISIGDYAFCSCKKIHSITLPSSLNNIGDNAFGTFFC